MRTYAIVEWGAPLAALDVETPQPTGAQVLVRTQMCGVCHSDVHVWEGYFDFGAKGRMRFADRGAKLPFTLGHEIVGTVVAKGPDAGDVEIGGSYVVYPWIGCGECAACRADDELMCARSRSIGLRCDGGYGDHVVVPDARYLVRYDGVSPELACTFACSGVTAYSALKKTLPLGADDWLCVIGAGGVGGSAIQMASALTPARLVVVDVDPAKRAAAAAAGAAATVDGRAADALAQISRITGGGAAAVIDFVGSGDTLALALDVARRGAKVILVGLYGGSAQIAPLAITTKVLTVQGSFVGTLDELKEVLALARQGAIAPIPITRRPAAESAAALAALKAGSGAPGRMVLVHDDG